MILEIRDLKKSWPSPEGGSLSVVDIAEFGLGRGEQLALRGSSGSGKTTFLNLIAGILQADSGTVEIAGVAMAGLGEAKRDLHRARHVGYVFQTFNLLQGFTALENVELAMILCGRTDKARATGLLERVGLGNRLAYRPGQLSVGQCQRVAIARALANDPSLVLADEPTGNLDPHHAKEALALLRDLCREKNAALLLVSHDPAVLAQFDNCRDLAEFNAAAVR